MPVALIRKGPGRCPQALNKGLEGRGLVQPMVSLSQADVLSPYSVSSDKARAKIKRRHGRLKRTTGKPNGDAGGKLDAGSHSRRRCQANEGRAVHLGDCKPGQPALLVP